MAQLATRQLGRTDRYVRKARLIVDAGTPLRKLAFMAEESLRLCSLPGEEEGRVYYFRHVYVGGLPESGDRQSWLHVFQHTLQEKASQAVHGCLPEAADADAVYFRNEEEPCETLLRMAAARIALTAWFWARMIGASTSNPAVVVTAVIEKLLATPASWRAVAGTVLSLRQDDVIAVLKMLPRQILHAWIRELGPASHRGEAVAFNETTNAILAEAIRQFGADGTETLWLASLAVIATCPASLGDNSVISIAHALLEKIRVTTDLAPPKRESFTQSQTSEKTFAVDTSEVSSVEKDVKEFGNDQPISEVIHQRQEALHPTRLLFGDPTSGAGLYFLLNVLRHLHVEEQTLSQLLLARLFLRIASHAALATGDPILGWAHRIELESPPEETDDRLLRIWLLKIRRWCWRNGRLSVREIVNRPGYVTLTRTDLDVTMYLDLADVRIRRIGLDLDPGWLPWFGRVVRFHYRSRGDTRG